MCVCVCKLHLSQEKISDFFLAIVQWPKEVRSVFTLSLYRQAAEHLYCPSEEPEAG